MEKWDFSGWATRNDLLCGDGRTIRRDAFKGNDGQIVPLIYNHQHNDPNAVLGHAMLENRPDGVYAYGIFNDTESGQTAKQLVEHGDVSALSIYANQLKQIGGDVVHGNIRELSLVLAGANPGAFIDFTMAHSDEEEDTLIASWDEKIVLHHSDENKEEKEKVADNNEKTVQDVIDSMTEEQKNVLYALVGEALGEDDEEGDEEVKHNVFDNDEVVEGGVLTHADQEMILADARKIGSFQEALMNYADDNNIQHDAISSGFAQTGEGNITYLFPEYHDMHTGAPELITDDQSWVSHVLAKTHKTPFSRIRTGQVDIRNADQLRARGYFKGKEKKIVGDYTLARRTTDPQTVYVKSALHRDDIIDITDFDIVQYQYNIDRAQLNLELATAELLGDGRASDDEAKIQEDKIRPIWTDDELFTIHYDLDLEATKKELQGSDTSKHFGENYILAEAMVNACLYSREKYKGSGTPDMYLTPHMLNVMMLARDFNGRRIYATKAELASVLNVNSIITIEQFEGKVRTDDDKKKHELLAMIVNLNDYSVGSTKGGEITHFTQFDIDFNQQKSLLETRLSGALTKIKSAIIIEKPVDTSKPSSTGSLSA